MRIETSNSLKTIIVRTYKYSGTEHRSWRARISRIEDSLIVLDAKFEEEILHAYIGKIPSGTISIEYYWLDRWYNIFRFLQPAGHLLSYYCNVCVPPVLSGHTLSYIDLDIDILVKADFTYTILDADEFTNNAQRFSYPFEVQCHAHQALNELVELIESHHFPFNGLK